LFTIVRPMSVYNHEVRKILLWSAAITLPSVVASLLNPTVPSRIDVLSNCISLTLKTLLHATHFGVTVGVRATYDTTE
jgi:hypothetical protein